MEGNKKGKVNIVTIIAIIVAVAAVAGIVCMLLMGSGVSQKKSEVTTKDMQTARAQADAFNSEEGVSVVGLDEDIKITPGGNSTQKTEESGEEKDEADTADTASDSEYILPKSNSEYLTDADVSGLSKSDLRIARNEILARHGRIFDSEDLKEYFESKSWYNGTISPKEFDANLDSRLNDVERANIEMIKKYE